MFGLVMAVLLSELVLRVLFFKTVFGSSIPRHYYAADKETGFDISQNFPEAYFKFGDNEHKIWSNELCCFDTRYEGDKEFILLVGDSFTWGFAPFDKKWGFLLEKELGKRVLKCGVEGYGSRQELLKIKKIINKVKREPELIIVGYCVANDLEDDYLFPNSTVINGFPVSQSLLKDIHTGEKGERLFGASTYVQRVKSWLFSNFVLYRFIRHSRVLRQIGMKAGFVYHEPLLYAFKPDKLPWLNKAWEIHLRNLKEIKDFAAASNAKLLFVLFPNKEQVYDFLQPEIKNADWYSTNNKLKDFFEKEGISYLDLTYAFRDYADLTRRTYLGAGSDLYWRYDGHLNIAGNRVAGLLIGRSVLEKGLIKAGDYKERLGAIVSQLEGLRKR